jgi:hypothetical protein
MLSKQDNEVLTRVLYVSLQSKERLLQSARTNILSPAAIRKLVAF